MYKDIYNIIKHSSLQQTFFFNLYYLTFMEKHRKQAQKLQTKFVQDLEFQREVLGRNKKYKTLLDNAKCADLSSISQELFVCYNRKDHLIFFYFGMLQTSKKENLHKLAMYFIKFFIKKPKDDYTFVFINTKANSDAYGLFKEVFLQLTIDHFVHLRQFILLRPTYYQRAQDYMTFSVFPSYLRNLTKHVFSGAELCNYLGISPQDFVDIVPSEIASFEFSKIKARKLSLEDQRINFQGQLQDQQERARQKQFQSVMKSILIIKPGKQTYHLLDYQLNKFGIPVILDVLIFYFKTHPEGLKQQGLFRKSVSIDEQTETLGELMNKNYDCLLNITNPHIIANLIKRFFANLKVPVFPYKQFKQLMHDQGVKDKKQQLKNIVQSLSQLNFLCLMFLIQFLKQDVITKVQYNKMTTQNISICFGPCLFRAEQASPADLIYASKCAIATRMLLDDFQYIFGDSLTRQKKYRASEDNRLKEFQNEMKQNIEIEKSQRSSKSRSSRSSASSGRRKKNLEMNDFKFHRHSGFRFSNTPKNLARNHIDQMIQNINQEEFDDNVRYPVPHYPPNYTFNPKVYTQFHNNSIKQRYSGAENYLYHSQYGIQVVKLQEISLQHINTDEKNTISEQQEKDVNNIHL